MVVRQRLVVMRMVMRLKGIFPQSVGMHVMCIMYVWMCMVVRVVQMGVCMVFCQMQPHPQRHQSTGQAQLPRDRFCKKHN